MTKKLLPFSLPPVRSSSFIPQWDGSFFQVDGSSYSVLEYSQNLDGWNDELTLLHENSAGRDNPVDVSSRLDALRQIESLNLNPGSVILEVGCSSGYLLEEINSSFPEALVMGADVVLEPLKKISKKLPDVPLFLFDLTACPLPNESVDVVVIINVLEHIENDQLALEEIFRILKRGGTLIMEVPSGPKLFDAYDKALNHFRRYTRRGVIRLLNRSGFVVTRKSHLGLIVYPGFILVKISNKLRNVKPEIVSKNIGTSGQSLLVKFAMKIESKYLCKLGLPFGIRILTTSKKP